MGGGKTGDTMPKPQLLIVEDDDATRESYTTFLAKRGFRVLEASDGKCALGLLPLAQIVLLDVMMPGLDGWEVAEHLQTHYPDKPVLMITALGATNQKLHGFALGIDDYLVKPVDLHELEARIRVLMRRNGIGTEITRGAIVIQPEERQVHIAGERVKLSPLEFDLLRTLAAHPGKVWSRADLLRSVWGEDYFGADRTVDVRVATVRRKLGLRPDGGQYIETIRNHGYRFATEAASND